jgi:putative acetyltransferase
MEEDYPYLVSFLMEPGILQFFPMSNEKEAQESARIWISYAQLNSSFTLVKEGIPIGICTIYPQYAKKLAHQSLVSIIITEKERGKGYGKLLLQHIEKVAKHEFNMTLLHLEVYESNPARHLYEKVGYKRYGIHRRFLKDGPNHYSGKILMQKWLD